MHLLPPPGRGPARALGLAVAGLLLFTQSRELATTVDTPLSRWVAYLAVVGGVALAAALPTLRARVRVTVRSAAAAGRDTGG